MKQTPIPLQECLKCGYKMDYTTGAFDNDDPSPGDVSLCLKCGKISIFDEQMRFREPTTDELLTILNDPKIIQAQIVISSFPKNKP